MTLTMFSPAVRMILAAAAVLNGAGWSFAAKIQKTVTYQSSVSTDANGPLDLKAELNYDSNKARCPIAVVMHGYSPIANFGEVRNNAWRLRDQGFFAISVAMRGRDGSDGIRDSGGVEIYDIYDAVEYVKSQYAQYVASDNVHITGYSGGGGNVMAALVRFPDYFRAGSSFFGISDYGHDPVNGWYFKGAAPSHQAQMVTDIGNPTLGNSATKDRYMARASCMASHNNPYSEIHLFVNHNEPVCPPVNHARYRDNALAHASSGATYENIRLHVGGYGQYVDLNNNGLNESFELQSWPHGFPTADQQRAAESWYIPRLLSGAIPAPTLAPAGTLRVSGWVKTRPFSLWLGNGQNAVGDLHYALDACHKTFKLTILTSDRSVTGTLRVETSDRVGQQLHAVLNGACVRSFVGGGVHVQNGLKDGDVFLIQREAQADLDHDVDVDNDDVAAFISCLQGPGAECGDACRSRDFDGDGDVDQSDFGALQRCLSGEGVPVDPECAN